MKIIRLGDIVQELARPGTLVEAAAGKDLLELMHLGKQEGESI